MLFTSQDYEYIINTITGKVIPGLHSLTPDRLIIGQPSHPRLLDRVVAPAPHLRDHPASTFFEFCFVAQGQMVITLNQRSYRLKQGDLCLVRPFTEHYESCTAEEKPYEALWGLERGIKRIALVIDRFSPQHSYNIPHQGGARNIRAEHRLLSRISDLAPTAGTNLDVIKDVGVRLFNSYLVRIRREMRIRSRNRILQVRKEHEVDRMAKVINYLSKHYKEDISIKDLAADFSLSIDQFEKLYRKIHGESVKQSQIRIRLEQAMVLMKDPALSITDICDRVGYENPLYFSRIFKNYCGYSPTAYLKKFRPAKQSSN